MIVLDKMNQLIGLESTKREIMSWAYRNRVPVVSIALEIEFETLKETVERFMKDYDYHGNKDEHKAWGDFLDYKYVEKEVEAIG